jgi:hypothetical protein
MIPQQQQRDPTPQLPVLRIAPQTTDDEPEPWDELDEDERAELMVWTKN